MLVPDVAEREQETTILRQRTKESGLKMFDTRDGDNDEEERNEFGGVVPHWRRERHVFDENRNDELVLSISCALSGNGGKVLVGRREERGVCVWDTNRPGHECQSWFRYSIEDELLCHGNEYNGFIENSDGNILPPIARAVIVSACMIYEMDLTGAIAA